MKLNQICEIPEIFFFMQGKGVPISQDTGSIMILPCSLSLAHTNRNKAHVCLRVGFSLVL